MLKNVRHYLKCPTYPAVLNFTAGDLLFVSQKTILNLNEVRHLSIYVATTLTNTNFGVLHRLEDTISLNNFFHPSFRHRKNILVPTNSLVFPCHIVVVGPYIHK